MIFSGIRFTRSVDLCVSFTDHYMSVYHFCVWSLCYMFFVDLRESDYPFDILKLFIHTFIHRKKFSLIVKQIKIEE